MVLVELSMFVIFFKLWTYILKVSNDRSFLRCLFDLNIHCNLLIDFTRLNGKVCVVQNLVQNIFPFKTTLPMRLSCLGTTVLGNQTGQTPIPIMNFMAKKYSCLCRCPDDTQQHYYPMRVYFLHYGYNLSRTLKE